MTCCDFSGFDQSDGSAVCFSTLLSFSRSLGASKILLKVVDFFPKRGVFLFQFFDHGIHRYSHKTFTTEDRQKRKSKVSPDRRASVVNRISTKPAQAAAFPQVRENATAGRSM